MTGENSANILGSYAAFLFTCDVLFNSLYYSYAFLWRRELITGGADAAAVPVINVRTFETRTLSSNMVATT